MLVVKGCESLSDNLELKNCFSKVVANTLSKQISSSFVKTLNPGVNKFNISFEVITEKKAQLHLVNTTNRRSEKYLKHFIKKIKVKQPAIIENKPVAVTFNIPLTINNNGDGPFAFHKMSRLVFIYDKSNKSNLRPTLEHCSNSTEDDEATKCLETYLVNGAFNSIDANKIDSLLEKGLNTFKIKISHNDKNEILEINPDTGSLKLDEIFKENIKALLDKATFKSPSEENKSFKGEMVLVINYLKK